MRGFWSHGVPVWGTRKESGSLVQGVQLGGVWREEVDTAVALAREGIGGLRGASLQAACGCLRVRGRGLTGGQVIEHVARQVLVREWGGGRVPMPLRRGG